MVHCYYAKMSVSCRIPRLLLFDIDCTLIRSRPKPPGSKKNGGYLMTALSRAFDKPVTSDEGVVYSGGTDGSLAEEILAINGITRHNCDNYLENITKAFNIMPAIVNERVSQSQLSWYSLPNVNELLDELAIRSDVKLGILTGNLYDIAVIKLKTAGVKLEAFQENGKLFGAFGSDHFVRDELVKIAKCRYSTFIGHSIQPNDIIIIGDSPKDISCAHHNRVPCVAVDTGFYDADQLSHADFVLSGGFSNLNISVNALVNTQHIS